MKITLITRNIKAWYSSSVIQVRTCVMKTTLVWSEKALYTCNRGEKDFDTRLDIDEMHFF